MFYGFLQFDIQQIVSLGGTLVAAIIVVGLAVIVVFGQVQKSVHTLAVERADALDKALQIKIRELDEERKLKTQCELLNKELIEENRVVIGIKVEALRDFWKEYEIFMIERDNAKSEISRLKRRIEVQNGQS